MAMRARWFPRDPAKELVPSVPLKVNHTWQKNFGVGILLSEGVYRIDGRKTLFDKKTEASVPKRERRSAGQQRARRTQRRHTVFDHRVVFAIELAVFHSFHRRSSETDDPGIASMPS